MRVDRLDLNQLASLDALLGERSVSRAAERVHLSQPALSASLARLRAFFGDPLLVQTGRLLRLTPFAESLVEPVRDLLLQVQTLARRRPEVDPALIDREVTLVCSDYVLRVLVAPMLARAEHEAPLLRFEVRSIAGYLREELDHGDVDLVVSLAGAMSPVHPSEKLFSDSFCCIAWTGNVAIGKRLTRARFLGSGHVTTVLGRGRAPTLDQIAMQAQGLARRVEVRVPAFTLLPACIVGTQRIATLHRSLAEMLAREWDVRVWPCPVPIPDVVIAAQWHRYQSHDPAIAWVRRALHTVAVGIKDGSAYELRIELGEIR